VILAISSPNSSVADPNPDADSQVFGITGSFYHQAKIVRLFKLENYGNVGPFKKK
jgi:hypothetical protein